MINKRNKKKSMQSLTWFRSYETIKFNTPDGDIDVGQYAVSESGRFIFRREQKNNGNTRNEKQKYSIIDLTEVSFDPTERTYYHEFLLPDGRIYREKTTKESYMVINNNNKNPVKEMTDQDIKKIKDDDKLWPHSLTAIQIQDI